jgi:hypothetical protein
VHGDWYDAATSRTLPSCGKSERTATMISVGAEQPASTSRQSARVIVVSLGDRVAADG